MTTAAVLDRLGLGRPELRAWVLYDWANSVFMTTVLQVFPIYFARVAAADLAPATATAWFGAATALAMALIAIASPVLGALADAAGLKKPLLGGFVALGVAATAGLWFVGRGDWPLGALLLVLGNIGVTGSFVFYDSLLPHVARPAEVGRVSAAGFAAGYLGGGLLLALNMLWIARPSLVGQADAEGATRVAFLSAAAWWGVFCLPLFLKVREPRPVQRDGEPAGAASLGVAFSRLRQTARELRRYRNAFLMLLAFLIYNDGINTIIRMGTAYGAEIGLPTSSLLGAVLLIQFLGVPFSLLFGVLGRRVGAKRAIFLGLSVYVLITLIGYFMRTPAHFFTLAVLVGVVMGGTQALSRALFASLIPRHKSAEFFGFYGVFDKFAGVVGPALFAAVAGGHGSSRPAILALVLFFMAGALVLSRVDEHARPEEPEGADARMASR